MNVTIDGKKNSGTKTEAFSLFNGFYELEIPGAEPVGVFGISGDKYWRQLFSVAFPNKTWSHNSPSGNAGFSGPNVIVYRKFENVDFS